MAMDADMEESRREKHGRGVADNGEGDRTYEKEDGKQVHDDACGNISRMVLPLARGHFKPSQVGLARAASHAGPAALGAA